MRHLHQLDETICPENKAYNLQVISRKGAGGEVSKDGEGWHGWLIFKDGFNLQRAQIHLGRWPNEEMCAYYYFEKAKNGGRNRFWMLLSPLS